MSADADHPQSMRAALARIADAGQLRSIAEPVDPRFELAAYLALLPPEQTVRFDALAGHPGARIVANLLPSRARIAAALGVTPAALQAALIAAIARPTPSRLVEHAPCQAVSVADPDLAALPIPTFFEGETGPYITAGAIVAQDPETGRGNLSFARLKPLGGNRALIGIAPNHHLATLARRAAARAETLPIAVTLGNHPAVLIAAALYLGLGDDEREVAGSLVGEPLELARCATSGLAVPAHCEIVLEGRLDPTETVVEGRVSEFHGYYEDYGTGQVVRVDRLTRRADAMLQVIQPGYHAEHVWIGAVAIAAGLARTLASSFAVAAVAVTPGGAGRLHAVVALADPEPGDAKRAIFAVWAAVSLVKRVTVVDADIDPWDPVAVEWAQATRLDAARDVVIVPTLRADRAEPLEQAGVVAKLGLDATRKPDDRDWRRAEPPADIIESVRRKLGLG
ncbi:MAG TPA: UbiD family decarboxylase [Candidatus Sulfotelmatobacter sp.]|nr:UbiD family decarboxylase [Candidatus Sulfotelmatobacter sp.]